MNRRDFIHVVSLERGTSKIKMNEIHKERHLSEFSCVMAALSMHLQLSQSLAAAKGKIRRRTSQQDKTKRTMLSFSLSSSSSNRSFSLYNINQPILARQTKLVAALPHSSSSSSFAFNPLRFSVTYEGMAVVKKQNRRGFGAVCYAAPLTARNLQWISTISSVVLMLAKGTAVQKSFLVPLFALQAPAAIISWIKGKYGVWAAFLALLVRLFFFIPGELELPFVASLLVIVAPHEVMNLRGTQEGAIIGLVIAGYLAFQHFSRTGSLQKAFDQGSIVATLAIICITAVSGLFLI
ncbi:cold regulated protein [Melia azedarach]|uniref:Cold regulated protein n=1 Tax=Melia azedarach TaxID=155640 RepID=A0ACC1WYR0_MELAZ|nr:cold regulated protein [Melia azedarach]